MEFIKSARKHSSRVSEIIYVLLNILLAVTLFWIVAVFNHGSGLATPPYLAYLVVILSKWRVFAVRPRFWWANIQANMLDLLLGLSVVTLLWQTFEVPIAQVIITVLYCLWLILLKPKTERGAIILQAAIAQFFVITALYTISYAWPEWIVVVIMGFTAYICAQHILSTYEETDVKLLSLVWALLVSELAWLTYHWAVAYNVAVVSSGVRIPQVALIVTILGYFALAGYNSILQKHKLTLSNVTWPAIFAGGMIVVILLVFNGLDPNNP